MSDFTGNWRLRHFCKWTDTQAHLPWMDGWPLEFFSFQQSHSDFLPSVSFFMADPADAWSSSPSLSFSHLPHTLLPERLQQSGQGGRGEGERGAPSSPWLRCWSGGSSFRPHSASSNISLLVLWGNTQETHCICIFLRHIDNASYSSYSLHIWETPTIPVLSRLQIPGI